MAIKTYNDRVVWLETEDRVRINVTQVLSENPPTRGPVLLVHGAGVRGNIFRAPVPCNLVDFLLNLGYDVWLENWRASIDLPRNPWTLDQAARYDHPLAVRTVLTETGRDSLQAIIHCQGSTSFLMSAMAGLVPQVRTIVTNAVSLFPVVPRWSRFKLNCLVPIVRLLTPYINPQWDVSSPGWLPKLLAFLVRMTHHECHNTACKMVSFTYGSGFPALWRHENLNDETHQWLRQEFADVPLTFFTNMAKCVRVGHLVSVEALDSLPKDFLAQPPKTEARLHFLAGAKNRCFLPESQVKAFEYFDRLRPNCHRLTVFEKYSHLDIFMGQNAAQDIFPLIAQALD